MDGSETRRGRPAMHRTLARMHDRLGWSGDADRFGEAGATLAGDLCLAWSDELLATSGLDPAALAAGRAVFDTMRTQLMGGQYLDVLEQVLPRSSGGGTTARARRVIAYKSAKYTVEHPLLVGGQLAGASAAQLAAYSAYGLPLGEAFQLRDDVLGVFGDPAQTGKPAGDDLREGKRTVLVAEAVSRGTASQVEQLDRLLGCPDLDPDGVDALRAVIADTGALAAVEQLITQLADQAQAALDTASVEQPGLAVLRELVVAATARTS
jgi:geranylgeranyl diphosphate synthase type I